MKDVAKKVRPTSDRVLIKEHTDEKEKKTASGIILPVGGEDKNSKSGEVVAVGPGRVDNGKTVPIGVKIGDKVLFQWGDKIKVENEEYFVVRESEILAVLKNK